jgi:peptidoglycan hydrolase-like protein with peptidoglycan-binding domain
LHSAGKLAAVIGNHPREFVGFAMGTIAVFTIVTNALFLQKGPHPAPIFAARPLLQHEATLAPRVPASQPGPVTETAPQARLQLVANIQRELGRKSYYDGPADGIWGAKTDAAVRDFVQATGVKLNPEASDGLLRAISTSPARTPAGSATPNRTPAGSATLNPPPADPIAKLIAPSTRITAVQRALADFGYGQIKPSGVFDPDTRAAIEKFERDHQLPVTGQISDRIVRELAAMTGRPLE